ncbi:MAG: glutamine-synthetase adenylyltransferase [Bryobacteraceae bacterium]|nr:glutamine-synthetase adenylyltransferase [Bryobacteraceae bacterium]
MTKSSSNLEAVLRSYSPFLRRFAEQSGQPLAELFETASLTETPPDEPLARVRKRALVRIALRDALGIAGLAETAEELSTLADALIEEALRRAQAESGFSGSGKLAVIALGKLGGCELNYSSDIDLMFVYRGGSRAAAAALAHRVTALLGDPGPDGFAYRVDLRLRPEGRLGDVAISLDAAREYYRGRARDWELQMLIKARTAAGDRAAGQSLLDFVEPLIYSTTLDFKAVEAVSESRIRIGEKFQAKRRADATDVKLVPGGIRDIEFAVQCLQRLHGGREPWVRHGGTQLALTRLHDKGLLADHEFSALAGAYEFLRTVEHRLQMLEDRQTHTLPTNRNELAALAGRIPQLALAPGDPVTALRDRLHSHFAEVRRIYDRIIQSPSPRPPKSRRVPAPLDRHPRIAERVTANPSLAGRVADVFEHSPWLADQLRRHPEYLDDTPRNGVRDLKSLRQHFEREMFRLLTASLCDPTPIFETLLTASNLAGEVVRESFEMALAEGDPIPGPPMTIVALGRLGALEFDLGSDADLLFVLPDESADRQLEWTRVAERLIGLLTTYTGDGTLLAVDTRLRPGGRDGELVQTERAYKEYFANRAEAWEGIAYMKARAVAGDIDRATEFLHELQRLDWRRYGQSGRSRAELAAMRRKLEEEQGAENPLKAGPGGYYDIDFALMYLRLKGAGMFFKQLNTPERIRVVEEMGHLDRADAQFLSDAATFYRAVDHGLRLLTGHSAGSLPKAAAQLDPLSAMVRRWTPGHLHDQELTIELSQIQSRTREYFDRLFR